MTRNGGLVKQWTRAVALLAAVAILTTACADSRPSVVEWQPRWELVVTGIPTEAELGPAPSGETCSETLSFLRSNTDDLLPTPDLAIEDTVRTWIEVAEDAFFSCPPQTSDIDGFPDAYAELRRLELEVETVLGTL